MDYIIWTTSSPYLELNKLKQIYTISFFTPGKLCDKPLLRDENIFPPTSVYSGSGDPNNGYANARIKGSGWCAPGSGTYLSLDLGKEYHITKVAIMGDKEQTKWSQSYSFKYSHDNTYKNSRQVCTRSKPFLFTFVNRTVIPTLHGYSNNNKIYRTLDPF